MIHLILNIDKGTWGQGQNFVIAMKNAKAGKNSRMYHYIFVNDNWDITTSGQVTYDKDTLLMVQTDINF